MLQLAKLCNGVMDVTEDDSALEISSIEIDSRACKLGSLFVAYQGTQQHGNEYIVSAIEHGAVAILSDVIPREYHTRYPDVVFLTHENPRKIVGELLARFYPDKPDCMVMVTGTNGKTSVAYYTAELWRLLGKKSVSIGTLGILLESEQAISGSHLTTPDVVSLHRNLSELKARGYEHVVIEASSHGLELDRFSGLSAIAAGWTNITHDHLDFHGDFDNYFKAKSKIVHYISQDGYMVLNRDVPEYETLSALCDIPHISYGGIGSDLQLISVEFTPQGQSFTLEYGSKTYEATVALMGSFQLHNVLCAIGLVLASGEQIDDIMQVVSRLKAVPGRMEWVTSLHARDVPVIVDYAHTPDALETVLKAIKDQRPTGQLWCVFGCGGDRDKGKRPQMGRVADHYADKVVVTDDNPRHEEPAGIRKAIIETCDKAIEIADRKQAIIYAIDNAQQGDTIVIAGKGHEDYQLIGDEIFPFSDKGVVLDATK